MSEIKCLMYSSCDDPDCEAAERCLAAPEPNARLRALAQGPQIGSEIRDQVIARIEQQEELPVCVRLARERLSMFVNNEVPISARDLREMLSSVVVEYEALHADLDACLTLLRQPQEAISDITNLRDAARNIESSEKETELMLLWRGKAIAYETVLARLSRQPQEPQWQPIETAPKDGTEVLLISAFKCAHSLYLVSSWEDGDWGMPDHWRMEPTHWMPLPSPPSGADQ